MTEHFDTLETRDPDERERALLAQLPRQIAHAKAHAPAFARLLADVDAGRGHHARRARAAAGDAQVGAARAAEGRAAVRRLRGDALGRGARACSRRPARSTSPKGARPDYWRLARALFAAGFRPGDLVHNCFSYHFTPAGSMLETGAHALGCTVFPGGTGQTEQQVQAIADLKPRRLRRHAVVPARSFSRRPTSWASRCRSSRKALVSGRGVPAEPARRACRRAASPATRPTRRRTSASIAYETDGARGPRRRRGRAGRDRAARHRRSGAPGEVGEVVVTTLFNADYPLIRFGTGDLSALLPGAEPLRAHQRADQGLDGPRRPDDQGEGHVRASGAGRRDRRAAPGDRARRGSSSTTRTAPTG